MPVKRSTYPDYFWHLGKVFGYTSSMPLLRVGGTFEHTLVIHDVDELFRLKDHRDSLFNDKTHNSLIYWTVGTNIHCGQTRDFDWIYGYVKALSQWSLLREGMPFNDYEEVLDMENAFPRIVQLIAAKESSK